MRPNHNKYWCYSYNHSQQAANSAKLDWWIPNKNHVIKRVKFGRDIVIGFIKDESLYKTLYTEYRHFHFSVENQKKTLICPSHKVTWQPDKRLNSFTVTRTRRRAGLSYIVKTLKERFTQITKKTKHIFSHLTSEVCGLSRAEVFKPWGRDGRWGKDRINTCSLTHNSVKCKQTDRIHIFRFSVTYAFHRYSYLHVYLGWTSINLLENHRKGHSVITPELAWES